MHKLLEYLFSSLQFISILKVAPFWVQQLLSWWRKMERTLVCYWFSHPHFIGHSDASKKYVSQLLFMHLRELCCTFEWEFFISHLLSDFLCALMRWLCWLYLNSLLFLCRFLRSYITIYFSSLKKYNLRLGLYTWIRPTQCLKVQILELDC